MSWYELHLEKDDNDTFFITSPSFPEVTTFSDFEDGIPMALINGRKAIEEAIAARISDGEDLPMPANEADGIKYSAQMTYLTQMKSSLYMLCRLKNKTRAELARDLNWHREQVDRLFRLDHNSRLDQFEEAFKALGITPNIGALFRENAA